MLRACSVGICCSIQKEFPTQVLDCLQCRQWAIWCEQQARIQLNWKLQDNKCVGGPATMQGVLVEVACLSGERFSSSTQGLAYIDMLLEYLR